MKSSAPSATRSSEELVLSTEHLADGVVGEDAPDRIGQELGAAEDTDVVGSAGAQRDRVGDDDLLEARAGEVLIGVAGEDGVRRGGVDAGGTLVEDGLAGRLERAR